jgi:hypothetical protein
MKTNHQTPLDTTLTEADFAGYRSKIGEISLFDFIVKLNRMFTEFLPEDAEEMREMQTTMFQAVTSKSNKRLSYSAQNEDMIISFTVIEKGGKS